MLTRLEMVEGSIKPNLTRLLEDVVFSTNRVLVGPAGLPDDIVQTLETAIAEITSDPAYQEQAKTAAVQIRYLDAAGARALWEGFDPSFKPLVDQFRSQQQ